MTCHIGSCDLSPQASCDLSHGGHVTCGTLGHVTCHLWPLPHTGQWAWSVGAMAGSSEEYHNERQCKEAL